MTIYEKIITDIWFLRRDIVSDGFDRALEYISGIIPVSTVAIPSGTECWTWSVPPKWTVREAWISSGSEVLLDMNDHPLHVMSYSRPVEKRVTREELLNHVHTLDAVPDAIPFEYSYYDDNWGFCVQADKMNRFAYEKYDVKIDASFEPGALKVGELVIPGKTKKEIVIAAHLCHPCMANDNLSGVAVAVALAQELLAAERANNYTYRFLFVPEMIGTIAYLSVKEQLIPNIKYGLVIDSVGNDNIFSLQHSSQSETDIDLCVSHVLQSQNHMYREGAMHTVCGSDERVLNGPGINIPTVCLTRTEFWSETNRLFPEYHTSRDTPDIITYANLEETKNILLQSIEILESNYIPKRTFRGPLFLSRYGLWVDWRRNKKLNACLNDIMNSLEGNTSVLSIAQECGLPYADVYAWLAKMHDNHLIEKWGCE